MPLALGVTVVSIALAAGCGGGSNGGSSTSADASYLAAVTRAAAATDSVPGYKLAMTMSVSQGGKSATAQGTGTINGAGSEGTMTMEAEGHKLAELIAKPYVYVELPGGAPASVARGKRWARIDIDTITQSVGDSSLGADSQDPAQTLAYLRAAGSVTRLGEEAVRGQPSTHYHAIIELDRLAAAVPVSQRAETERAGALLERVTGSKTMPMDVWIGADGRVSRVSYGLSLCSPEGRANESFNLELFGYGRQPVIAPPPASEVADVDAQVKAELAKGLAQLTCH